LLDFSIKYFLIGRTDGVDEEAAAKAKVTAALITAANKQVLLRTGLALKFIHRHRVLKICLCAKIFDVIWMRWAILKWG
jgi:hypothetical protein